MNQRGDRMRTVVDVTSDQPVQKRRQLFQHPGFSVLAVACVAALALTGFTVWASSGDADDAVAVADTFAAPAGWVLESEQVTVDMPVCLGGNACPSIVRNWTSKDVVTTKDLNNAVLDSGFRFPTAEDCVNACSAEGTVDGYRVRLTASTPAADPGKSHITLSVR